MDSHKKAVALVKSRRAASPGMNEARDLEERVFAWNTIAKSLIDVAPAIDGTATRSARSFPLATAIYIVNRIWKKDRIAVRRAFREQIWLSRCSSRCSRKSRIADVSRWRQPEAP
jgi:hypothetical protein